MAVEKRNYTFKPFEELEFTDDYMFKKIMQNKEICIGVIERLLKIEALGKRMRYYQSMIDIDDLMKGADYRDLKESYVIFICKTSPFSEVNLPVYSFRNICAEDHSVELNDKTQKLVYNASAYEDENDDELKSFLQFVCSGSVTDDFTERINTLVIQAKMAEANKTEYMGMNLHDRDILMIGREEGREEGAMEKAVQGALVLIRDFNASPELAAEKMNAPLDKILELVNSDSVSP